MSHRQTSLTQRNQPLFRGLLPSGAVPLSPTVPGEAAVPSSGCVEGLQFTGVDSAIELVLGASVVMWQGRGEGGVT